MKENATNNSMVMYSTLTKAIFQHEDERKKKISKINNRQSLCECTTLLFLSFFHIILPLLEQPVMLVVYVKTLRSSMMKSEKKKVPKRLEE